MRNDMHVGDWVLFYHSNAKPPGVVGIAEIASGPYVDHTQFDPEQKYFDPKSDPENPRWIMVDVSFVEKLPRLVSLHELKEHPQLAGMVLLNRSRLSVQPVTSDQFDFIVDLARSDAG